ncbi:MAG: MFS transporter [Candidatus Tectomicrobia bacterium]|nr:MFS transporter [Candidatus Tectomicrobia bacterium]
MQEKTGGILAALFMIMLANLTSLQIMTPILPIVIREFGITPQAGGYLSGAFTLMIAVTLVLGGPLSDRYGRVRLMKIGIITFAIGTSLSATSFSYALLLASRFLTGIGFGLISPNVIAMVGDVVPYARRGFAMSVIVAGFFSGRYFGVGVLAFIAEKFGWRIAFLAILGLAFVALLGLLWEFPKSNTQSHSEPLRLSTYLLPYRTVLTNRAVWSMTTVNLLQQVAVSAFLTFLGAWVVSEVHQNISFTGWLFMIGGIGGVTSSPIVGRLADRVGKVAVLTTGTLIQSTCMGILPRVSFTELLIILLFFLIIACGPSRSVPLNSIILEIVPDNRGAVVAVNELWGQIGLTIGATLGGYLYSGYGYKRLGLICSAINLLALLLFRVTVKEPAVRS